MATPAMRPCRPRLTVAEGPPKSRRASCAPEATATSTAEAKTKRRELAALRFALASVLAFAVASARRERAALPGAPMARRAGGGKSAGWPAGMPASFSPAQDVLSKNPATRPRTRRAGCPEGAPSGCRFSLATFSLGTQRESSSTAHRAGESLCSLQARLDSKAATAPAAITCHPATPPPAPPPPASATARPGGCRSSSRSIPTSPSMPADSRARSLRGSEGTARPRRRRRPSG